MLRANAEGTFRLHLLHSRLDAHELRSLSFNTAVTEHYAKW